MRDAAHHSSAVLTAMQAEQKHIQWEHSYVAADKTFCIYLAESEALVFEHAKLGGFPVTKVTEVPTVISPMTAY